MTAENGNNSNIYQKIRDTIASVHGHVSKNTRRKRGPMRPASIFGKKDATQPRAEKK